MRIWGGVMKMCFVFLKYHRFSGLNNRNLFSHSSGNSKVQDQVLADMVSLEASLFGLQVVTFFLCPHMTFPLFTCVPGVPLYIQIFFSYKDTSNIRLISPPNLGPLFNLITSLKFLSPKYTYIPRSWG